MDSQRCCDLFQEYLNSEHHYIIFIQYKSMQDNTSLLQQREPEYSTLKEDQQKAEREEIQNQQEKQQREDKPQKEDKSDDKEEDNEEGKDNKEDDRSDTKKNRRRERSPEMSIAELSSKKIELIIYVGNLPVQWGVEKIEEYFRQFGDIIEVRQIHRSGGFSGSALIKFKSMSQAEEAITKLRSKYIEGAQGPVNIKWLDTEEQRLGIGQNENHKLFVGSLPRQASRQSLYEVFSIMGEIQSISLQEQQFWAFVCYTKKESALLAIKYLNGQTYMHGSKIPIQVRFKEKKYNSFMTKKHEKDELDPFAYSYDNLYHEIINENQKYFYNYKKKASQFQLPPAGAKVFYMDASKGYYIQPQTNIVNEMFSGTTKYKSGPPGSNLFLFHLPNDMKDTEMYSLFKKFGNIVSIRIMTERGGRSKGVGFVSYENPAAANAAIDEMNGFEVRGKRLKVELNRKDEMARQGKNVHSLSQARYDTY